MKYHTTGANLSRRPLRCNVELEQANELITRLEDMGYEAELYEKYSGRCMYGDTTIGIVTDASPFSLNLVKIKYPRWDSMGLNYIYY